MNTPETEAENEVLEAFIELCQTLRSNPRRPEFAIAAAPWEIKFKTRRSEIQTEQPRRARKAA